MQKKYKICGKFYGFAVLVTVCWVASPHKQRAPHRIDEGL